MFGTGGVDASISLVNGIKNSGGSDLEYGRYGNDIKAYTGSLSGYDLDVVRPLNTLEREMSPVHSYNDVSKVFSAEEIFDFASDGDSNNLLYLSSDTNFTGTSAQKDRQTLQDGMINFLVNNDVLKPSFRRIDSGVFEGYYILNGYSIGENFKYIDSYKTTDNGGDDSFKDTLAGLSFISYTSDEVEGASDKYLSKFKKNIRSELNEEWKSATINDLLKTYLTDRKMDKNDDDEFVFKDPGQFLRYSGKGLDTPAVLGLKKIPNLTYKWDTFRSAYQGMLSVHNKIRIYYFIMQAYTASLQTINRRLDSTSTTGTAGIESDLQLFEKRLAKQVDRYRQLMGKTNQLAGLNNTFYTQKIQSIKDSDIAKRVFDGITLYGGLVAAACNCCIPRCGCCYIWTSCGGYGTGGGCPSMCIGSWLCACSCNSGVSYFRFYSVYVCSSIFITDFCWFCHCCSRCACFKKGDYIFSRIWDSSIFG